MLLHKMIVLKQGQILDNNKLCELFRCSSQGGMRRSHETNTLVIVSNHIKSIYEDKWIDDVMHYTGMGTSGDQSLFFSQNKTLANTNTNDVEVHLFEVFKLREYYYQGIVKLSSDPETIPPSPAVTSRVYCVGTGGSGSGVGCWTCGGGVVSSSSAEQLYRIRNAVRANAKG